MISNNDHNFIAKKGYKVDQSQKDLWKNFSYPQRYVENLCHILSRIFKGNTQKGTFNPSLFAAIQNQDGAITISYKIPNDLNSHSSKVNDVNNHIVSLIESLNLYAKSLELNEPRQKQRERLNEISKYSKGNKKSKLFSKVLKLSHYLASEKKSLNVSINPSEKGKHPDQFLMEKIIQEPNKYNKVILVSHMLCYDCKKYADDHKISYTGYSGIRYSMNQNKNKFNSKNYNSAKGSGLCREDSDDEDDMIKNLSQEKFIKYNKTIGTNAKHLSQKLQQWQKIHKNDNDTIINEDDFLNDFLSKNKDDYSNLPKITKKKTTDNVSDNNNRENVIDEKSISTQDDYSDTSTEEINNFITGFGVEKAQKFHEWYNNLDHNDQSFLTTLLNCDMGQQDTSNQFLSHFANNLECNEMHQILIGMINYSPDTIE